MKTGLNFGSARFQISIFVGAEVTRLTFPWENLFKSLHMSAPAFSNRTY